MTSGYTDNDLYNMFVLCDKRDILNMAPAAIRQQVSELIDEEHNDREDDPLPELDEIVAAIIRVARDGGE